MNLIILKSLIVFRIRQNVRFYLCSISILKRNNNLNPQKESAKEKKVTVCDNASELYNEYLEIYFDEYKTLSGSHKRNLGNKYDPTNLFLETYD